jgi:tungstate transport system ATP-binding protein
MRYSVDQLIKTYNDRTVLHIDSLEIETGQIYALLGPNGAGKTTLLNILGFLDTPTTGTVLYQNKRVEFSEAYLQTLRKSAVVVDQQPILFTTTVFKNLEFGLKVRKVPSKKRNAIIDEALDLVGMRDFTDAQAHRLSGGETQRVAVARALAVSPEVLLFDEPTAGVDVESQAAIIRILDQINRGKKITILFSTHDRSHAKALAHQTLLLNNGKLSNGTHENIFQADISITDNTRAEVLVQDTFRLYLPMNRIHSTGRNRVVIDPQKVRILLQADAFTEHLQLAGRIVQAGEEAGMVRIVVDAGVPITVILPKDEYRDLRPMVGDRVFVDLPPEAIQVL